MFMSVADVPVQMMEIGDVAQTVFLHVQFTESVLIHERILANEFDLKRKKNRTDEI